MYQECSLIKECVRAVHTHTHTPPTKLPSFDASQTITIAVCASMSYFLSLSLTHSHTHKYEHTHTHTHTLTHSLTHSLIHIFTFCGDREFATCVMWSLCVLWMCVWMCTALGINELACSQPSLYPGFWYWRTIFDCDPLSTRLAVELPVFCSF